MLSSGANVIIWDEMLLSGNLGRNVIIRDAMLLSGANVTIWDEMLSSGMKCYHMECNVIIWDKMLSCGANVVMLSFGANVIIWCYHVMLSSGMITPPFFFFLKTSLTPLKPHNLIIFRTIKSKVTIFKLNVKLL
jgi:hypothetical protein